MAVKDTPSMGIRHVTVVPTNLRPSEDDDESGREPRREPRVPRHR